jgi:hypothetical protein
MRILLFVLFISAFQQVYFQSGKIAFGGMVTFTSDAPLELIEASSSQLTGIMDTLTRKFAFTVKVSTFEGFNSALQKEHFHENYMETSLYPNLQYSGTMLDVPDLRKNGTYTVRTKGVFMIHGIKKERIINNKITVRNGNFQIESKFSLSLSDFNITIPRIVDKKIAEEVNISVLASNRTL